MKEHGTRRTKVFVSYSHQDKKWLGRLQRHLKPLERDYAIEVWDDTKIGAGAKWRGEIEKALRSAKVAVLLVSADFLASEFIASNELPPLLAAADEEGATILPVIVSPCRFARTESLSQFQAVNSPSKTLINMSKGEQESLFVKLTEEIEAALGPQKRRPTPTDEREQTARKKTEGLQRVREEREEEKAAAVILPHAPESAAATKPEKTPQFQQPTPAVVEPSEPQTALTAALTLSGHGDSVNCVAFSPDGALLASGAGGEVFFDTVTDAPRLWRVSDGKLLQTLKGHTRYINSVAFSPDGTTLASGSGDQIIRLWRVADGDLLGTLTGHTHYVSSVVFSPDGSLLASASYDKTVCLWHVSDGKLMRKLEGHKDFVNSVAFSPDGATLASGSGTPLLAGSDYTARLWRVADGELLHTLEGHTKVVWAVAFSPDGTILASGSRDNTVRLWHVPKGRLLRKLEGHAEQVVSVAFSPDGTMLASAGGAGLLSIDNTVRLWSIPNGKLLSKLEGHKKAVHSVAFSPDGTMLASASADKTIRLWRLK